MRSRLIVDTSYFDEQDIGATVAANMATLTVQDKTVVDGLNMEPNGRQ